MSKNKTAHKKIVTSAAQQPAAPKPGKLTTEEMKALSLTDPKRRLTKAERKALTTDQRKERKANIRAARPPAKVRYAKLLDRSGKRFVRLAKQIGSDKAMLDAIQSCLGSMAVTLSGKADDWSPTKVPGIGGAVKFTKGQLVRIKADRRADYEGLLDKDELDGIMVEAASGKQVACKTEGGVKMFIPSRNLEADA